MRYDTPIYFQLSKPGAYNPDTGNYEPDTIKETQQLASVTNSGTETLNLVYGELKQGSLTIRLQNHYNEPFSRIRIGEKIYRVDMARKLKTKHSFIVSEAQ